MKGKTHTNFLYLLLPVSFVFYTQVAFGQELDKKTELLSQGLSFYPLLFDLNECQSFAGIYYMKSESMSLDGVFIPVNLGIQQSLLRYHFNECSDLEIAFGAGAFTQFEIRNVEDQTFLGQMLNTDYKASLYLNLTLRALDMRLRLFHISSHLADDYMLRNQITRDNPGTMNYEQIDFMFSTHRGPIRYYAGCGMVITPSSVRQRFSSQAGISLRKNLDNRENIGLIGGADIKFLAENQFSPDFRTGIGIAVGRVTRTYLAFLVEFYHGHSPYSTIDYGQMQWIGLSTRLMKGIRTDE